MTHSGHTTGTIGLRAINDEKPAHSTIAQEAASLQYGDREDAYGHPRVTLTRTAAMWSVLLGDKLDEGSFITPEDVARMMTAMKLTRDTHAPKRDNRVDAVGYLIALDRLETGL